MTRKGYYGQSEKHSLNARGYQTKEGYCKPNKLAKCLHPGQNKPCGTCVLIGCPLSLKPDHAQYNNGYDEAEMWINAEVTYSEKEIKKLTLNKLMDYFYRYTSYNADLPSPDKSPTFYIGARCQLKNWLEYQKSHI
jgi:hypothetical protein